MDNIHGKYLQPLQNCRENVPEWFGGQIGIKKQTSKTTRKCYCSKCSKAKGIIELQREILFTATNGARII